MADEQKTDTKKRKRTPARFVIQELREDDWIDLPGPDYKSTQECVDEIKREAGISTTYRVIQIRKTIKVEVKQTPTTTITDVE